MTTLYNKSLYTKMKQLFCLLATLLVFTACNRPRTIPDDKLTAIVGDIFLANAYWDIHGNYQFARDSIDIYSPIFEQYGFTPKDFMFTIENFSKRKSIKFTDVLQAALDTLQAGGRPWFDASARRDSIDKIAAELFKKQVYFDSLPHHYTHPSRAEDKPVIKLDVEPGEYKIEWDYEVDTADHNSYIQYMHHLSDNTGRKSNYTYRSYRKGQRRHETATVNVTSNTISSLNIYPVYTTSKTDQVTSVTIDSLRVTYYIPQQQAIDSITSQITFKPTVEIPTATATHESSTQNIIPLRLDTTELPILSDSVIYSGRDTR